MKKCILFLVLLCAFLQTKAQSIVIQDKPVFIASATVTCTPYSKELNTKELLTLKPQAFFTFTVTPTLTKLTCTFKIGYQGNSDISIQTKVGEAANFRQESLPNNVIKITNTVSNFSFLISNKKIVKAVESRDNYSSFGLQFSNVAQVKIDKCVPVAR